jgi:hypothetical protein
MVLATEMFFSSLWRFGDLCLKIMPIMPICAVVTNQKEDLPRLRWLSEETSELETPRSSIVYLELEPEP